MNATQLRVIASMDQLAKIPILIRRETDEARIFIYDVANSEMQFLHYAHKYTFYVLVYSTCMRLIKMHSISIVRIGEHVTFPQPSITVCTMAE